MASLSDLVTTTRLYIDETDTTNTHFTDTQLTSLINKAVRFMGTDLEWPIQTAQATSVLDQAVYDLPENFISLLDVFFDNDPLAVLERGDMKSIRTDWQNAESGKPLYAYKSDNRKFGIYPKPDSTNAGLSIQIQYIKIPIDLSLDTDTPDLHFAFQDCLPFYAAYLAEKSLGNSKKSQENFTDYITHKKILMTKVQNFSDSLMRFVWTGR